MKRHCALLLFALSTAPIAAQETIGMEFRDTKVSDILRAMSEHFGVNVVLSGSLDRSVSLRLADMTLAEAMDTLLEGSGYVWTREKDSLRVVPADTPASRVFPLRYSESASLAGALQAQMETAVVTPEPHSNSVLVKGTIADVLEAAQIIAQVDRYRSQVSIRAEMIEVTLTESDILGVDLNGILNGTQASGSVGTGWSTGNEEANFRVSTIQGDLNITAILHAIQEDREASLLSSPSITTLDNQPARIHVGERVPYQKATTETETGSVLAEVEFMDVGVKLEVTPTISDDDMLYLLVHSEVSEVLDQSVLNVPRIGTREADTRVLVRHGDTVVIGGLMRDNLIRVTKKVPILGDIPLLGRLFRRDTSDKTKTEFLVFIHPQILKDPSQMAPSAEQEELMGRMGKR